MNGRIAVVECRDCRHKWVEVAGERDRCFLCESRELGRPLLLVQLRQEYRGLSPSSRDYAIRLPLLERLYFEISPMVLDRARDVYGKVQPIYERGDRSDRVLNRLIFCFFAFEELGLHESAAACGNLIALGYLERGDAAEVTRPADLADLGRALQWFGLVHEPEWVATVNVRIGSRAAHAVTDNTKEYRHLLQVAHMHLDLARSYYVDRNMPGLVEEIDRELGHVSQILAGAAVGSGYVEGAEIQAAAYREMGQALKAAVESAGEYIGLSIREAGEAVAGATDAEGRAIASAIGDHGEKVKRGLDDVARSAGIGLASLSHSVHHGLGRVSSSLVRLGDKTEESFDKLGTEMRAGLVQASENIRKEMGSLGNKVALGVVGGGAIGGLLASGAAQQLGATVSNALAGASNTLAEATRRSGELEAGPQNVLISQGFDAARGLLRG